MRKLNFLLSVAILLTAAISYGQQLNIINKSSSTQTKAELLQQSAQSKTISLKVNAYSLKEVETPKGVQYAITVPNGTELLKKGNPNLPKIAKSIALNGSQVKDIKILDSKFKEYKNIELAPSKGNLSREIDPKNVPFTYGKAYKTNAFYPGNMVDANEPYIFRDHQGVSLWFYPVQYNPVTKTLRIYTEITVEVIEDGVVQKSNKKPEAASIFQQAYLQHFLGYSDTRYSQVSEEGSLLIITYDNFEETMLPFVEWKRQRGIKTEIVKYSEVGSSASDIKNFVRDYYNNNGLTFLMLIGDHQQVPAMYINSYYSDATYGHIDGNDSYAEVIVGRFSGTTTNEIATQVERTISYERDLTENDTWLNKAVGIASDEGGNGQGDDGESDIEHMNNIRTDLLDYGYTTVDQIYDPGATDSELANVINEGRGLINYVGHGGDQSFVTTGFNNSDVNALTNTGKLPFIFSVACVNGNFTHKTCFAEAWMRATHNDKPSGAVAIIASTINQDWEPPMDGQDEMNDLLTHIVEGNTKITFGGVTINGCMHMNDNYGASGSEMTDTWTIFGDPTLILRNKAPKPQAFTYNKVVTIGTQSFEVISESNGAIATLSNNDGIISTASIQNGKATLDISSILAPGEIKLTIVGQNIQTITENILIIVPSGPYLIAQGSSISADDNNNGLADFGENIELTFSLKNVGVETAKSVNLDYTTSSAYVETLTNNSGITLGDLEKDKIYSFSDIISFKLKNNVPDQEKIVFDLKISAENFDSAWNYQVIVNANAPVLTVSEVSINDNFDGNIKNGRIDAGETAEVVFKVDNTGNTAIDDFKAILSETNESGFITINTEFVDVTEFATVSSTLVTFSVSASETTPLEQKINTLLSLTAGQYTFDHEEVLTIGKKPIYIMGKEDVVIACNGKFYDSGAKDDDYSNNENKTITFKPEVEGNLIAVSFEQFNIEFEYDYLYAYNGSDRNATQIEGSPFTGESIPANIIAQNEDGSLTFHFSSDSYSTAPGWEATVSCIDPAAIPECVDLASPENNAELTYNNTTLSWTPSMGAVKYNVYLGETLPETPSYTTSDTAIFVQDLISNAMYQWKVVPVNYNGDSPESCSVQEFKAGLQMILMQDGSSTLSYAYFMDDGGNENYSNNADYTLTLLPEKDGNFISVAFEYFELETGYDTLYIYDSNTTSNLIGAYDVTDYTKIGTNGVVTATNASGALTFRFKSDGYENKAGWKAVISNVVSTKDYRNSAVSIYPNPAQNIVNITGADSGLATLLDASGRILQQQDLSSSSQFDVANLKNGIYFIKVSKENTVFHIEKVIIQR